MCLKYKTKQQYKTEQLSHDELTIVLVPDHAGFVIVIITIIIMIGGSSSSLY